MRRQIHQRACEGALVMAAIGLLCLGPVATAGAQGNLPQRRLGVAFQRGVPQLSFSARDLLDRRARDKLQSGLPQTIVMRIYAYPEGGSRPVAIAPRACRVVYDLWEEVYRLQVQTDTSDQSVAVHSLEEVASRCLMVRSERVGTAADYRTGTRSLYFAVIVELNPMSPDTVQRIRRWLARPAGGRLGGEAFFGSFVSLFVNRRIGEAERTVRFRSPTVTVP